MLLRYILVEKGVGIAHGLNGGNKKERAIHANSYLWSLTTEENCAKLWNK